MKAGDRFFAVFTEPVMMYLGDRNLNLKSIVRRRILMVVNSAVGAWWPSGSNAGF